MKFSSFFNPVAGAIRAAALALSKADGKPGLTVDDFSQIIGWAKTANDTMAVSDKAKADWVTQKILDWFGPKIRGWSWVAPAISWVAYYVGGRIKAFGKKAVPPSP